MGAWLVGEGPIGDDWLYAQVDKVHDKFLTKWLLQHIVSSIKCSVKFDSGLDGKRGMKRLGLRRWRTHVTRIIELIRHGLQAYEVALGGGEATMLDTLPRGVRRVENDNAVLGGIRVWADPKNRT